MSRQLAGRLGARVLLSGVGRSLASHGASTVCRSSPAWSLASQAARGAAPCGAAAWRGAGGASRGFCAAAFVSHAPPFAHPLVPTAAAQRAVGAWLAGGAAWVFSSACRPHALVFLLTRLLLPVVVLGGVTRLTRSGLSMTEWKFSGEPVPRSRDAWEAEFAKYRASPEWAYSNRGMSLAEFKFIYGMEYAHRMWGRGLGLYFAVPLAFFAARGFVKRPLGVRLAALFAAGGSQGLVGWWMVKSGLEAPPDPHGVPRVSPYRLATHLASAFAIYAGIVWTALDVAKPHAVLSSTHVDARRVAAALRLRPAAAALACLAAVTAASGAFVAGLDAGREYNTFPLMEGRLVPASYWRQPAVSGGDGGGDGGDGGGSWWSGVAQFARNAAENPAAAQFHHRVMATTTLVATAATWATFAGAGAGARLPGRPRFALHLLAAATAAQASLGVATLLHAVPVWMGAAHQAGALTLFTASLWLLHSLRAPPGVARRVAAAVAAAAGRSPAAAAAAGRAVVPQHQPAAAAAMAAAGTAGPGSRLASVTMK